MERIEVGRVRVVFELVGEGPAVVFLHGVLGDSRMWRRQLDELCEEFTLVAWDAPGSGGSSDPPARFRLPDYADLLAAFVDRLALARPHVVGVAFGVAARDGALPTASDAPAELGPLHRVSRLGRPAAG